jgi:hypothetical protein
MDKTQPVPAPSPLSFHPDAWFDENNDPVVVALTATKYSSLDEIRCRVALRTATRFGELQVQFVVMDGGSPEEVKQAFRDVDAIVVDAPRPGLATQYLDGIRFIQAHGGENCSILKLEPEKDSMADPDVLDCIKDALYEYGTVVIGRDQEAMLSLPPVQLEVEFRVGQIFAQRYNMPADALSGGRAWTPASLAVWVPRYEALLQEHGSKVNNWLYLYTGVLDVRDAGLRVGGIRVNLVHPSEIVAEETGNPVFDKKRRDQEAIQLEWMEKIYGPTHH